MLLSTLRLGSGARSPLRSERSVRSGQDMRALVRTQKRQSTANNRCFYDIIASRWVYMSSYYTISVDYEFIDMRKGVCSMSSLGLDPI